MIKIKVEPKKGEIVLRNTKLRVVILVHGMSSNQQTFNLVDLCKVPLAIHIKTIKYNISCYNSRHFSTTLSNKSSSSFDMEQQQNKEKIQNHLMVIKSPISYRRPTSRNMGHNSLEYISKLLYSMWHNRSTCIVFYLVMKVD